MKSPEPFHQTFCSEIRSNIKSIVTIIWEMAVQIKYERTSAIIFEIQHRKWPPTYVGSGIQQNLQVLW